MSPPGIALVVFLFYGGKLTAENRDLPDVEACKTAAATIMRAAGHLHLAGQRFVCMDNRTGEEMASGTAPP